MAEEVSSQCLKKIKGGDKLVGSTGVEQWSPSYLDEIFFQLTLGLLSA